jgi:hypothetical protein
MMDAAESAEIDAIANSLVSITRDAESTDVTDAELVRRVNLIVDSYLATPDTEETALRRARLAEALQAKCGGPGCVRVVAHILRDD